MSIMSIKATPRAVEELNRLISATGSAQSGVRISVKGGGCSGFSYAMEIEPGPGQGDEVFEVEGVRIFCDAKSFLYLNGLELDFQDTVMQKGFVFKNPNATGTCGCGTSFSI